MASTLRQKCMEIVENSKSGIFSIPSYYEPIVPDDLADQTDDIYTIVMPESLWVLRLSDIPKNDDFDYAEVLPKVLVYIQKKSAERFYKEEELHKINGYVDLEEGQQKLFESTFDKHMKSRGTEKQKEYAAFYLKEIKWDAAEFCLKVYYKNGDWWHYDTSGTWY